LHSCGRGAITAVLLRLPEHGVGSSHADRLSVSARSSREGRRCHSGRVATVRWPPRRTVPFVTEQSRRPPSRRCSSRTIWVTRGTATRVFNPVDRSRLTPLRLERQRIRGADCRASRVSGNGRGAAALVLAGRRVVANDRPVVALEFVWKRASRAALRELRDGIEATICSASSRVPDRASTDTGAGSFLGC
jgi:hypothetical protein